jgi:predicted TIM-barrel fold metal-dependent hydrolase
MRENRLLDKEATFADPILRDAGLAPGRKITRATYPELPSGFEIISSDNHVEITQDIFAERFPQRLKDKAPRVWFEGYWRIGFPGASEALGLDPVFAKFAEVITLFSAFDMDTRAKHMDLEGISKEIIYPQSLFGFIRHPDLEVRELIFRTYNEYLAEVCATNRKLFEGVAICSNWWDPNRTEAAVKQIVDLGFKTFMIPNVLGKDEKGYTDPAMDRFWSVIEDAGLPVSFHIGEGPFLTSRGGLGASFLVQTAPFRSTFGQLIFGGVLDRHPKLRIVFAEGGINWAAAALQDAEMAYDTHRSAYDVVLKHRPSYYWNTNCYATFQSDPIGMRLLDLIGVDRVMWALDYPHGEGTFGLQGASVKAVLKATSLENAKKILGDTARALYRF